jgi:hypothetical protein
LGIGLGVGFGVRSVPAGGAVKMGTEQKEMNVTAPLLVVITLIDLAFSVSILKAWKELSPKSGTWSSD